MIKKLKILVIEDNAGDARLIGELLKDSELGHYEITYLSDTVDMESVDNIKFDIILLDLHLADMTPLKTYKTVYEAYPKIPIVVLTGLEDDDLAAKIVRLGAQDYLIKGTFGPSTLKRTIRYSIERKKSQLRLIREQNKSRLLKKQTGVLEVEAKRLKGINDAKDVFLSIASHQLRTPATSVKQYLGMLLEGYGGEIPDGQKTLLETAYQSNERQLKIVEDLLKVARLDAGHVTLDKKSIDMNRLIKRVIEDQSQSFSIRHQNVEFSPPDNLEPIEIDESNIQMVFENILDNAGKYSKENTDILIKLTKNGNTLSIDFIDHGIGISKSDKSKLFQKFSRVSDSFKYSPNGSGLGLYWAKEIVKLHNGSIRIDSTLGKGSTFTIDLPYSQQ